MSADIEWTDTRDGDAPLVKLAAMLQALEMEPAAVNLSAQQLAVICRGITKVAKRASTPPPPPSVSEGSVAVGEVYECGGIVICKLYADAPPVGTKLYAAAPQPTTKKGRDDGK